MFRQCVVFVLCMTFLESLVYVLGSSFLPCCLLDYASTTLWPELERRYLLLFNWDYRPFLRVLLNRKKQTEVGESLSEKIDAFLFFLAFSVLSVT